METGDLPTRHDHTCLEMIVAILTIMETGDLLHQHFGAESTHVVAILTIMETGDLHEAPFEAIYRLRSQSSL